MIWLFPRYGERGINLKGNLKKISLKLIISVIIAITGVPLSIKDIGPCFNSPAA